VLQTYVSTGNDDDLPFPGCFSNFTYQHPTQLVVNFYHWTEKTKLGLYLSEEPKSIISSTDLQFMVVIYLEKYVIYSFENNKALTPIGIHYYKIHDAHIYDNFVLIFLTDKGSYFQILNEENSIPSKLLKFSDEMNLYHLKISKKIKEKTSLHARKLIPQKILGLFNNHLITATSFNELTIKEVDNLLFKIIHLINTRKFNEITYLLTIIEKKHIKSILGIFKYYFNNNEDILKKIFVNVEFIEHFQLYKYLDIFLPALIENKFNDRNKMDKYLRSLLVKSINNKDEAAVSNLYEFANKNEL
jgi:hypothetical protein